MPAGAWNIMLLMRIPAGAGNTAEGMQRNIIQKFRADLLVEDRKECGIQPALCP